MLSPFLVSPLKTPYSILFCPCYQPTPSHFPFLAFHHRPRWTFPGPKDSPSFDIQQGHPLLHIQLEPWVPPCVLFDWWFSPWEFWGYSLVHIVVLPMELQAPPASLVLSLAPPLGTFCSVQ